VTNMKTTGMSREEISARTEWKSLTPSVKRILNLYFDDAERSLVDSVANFHPNLLPDVQRQVADNLMQNKDVLKIVNLFFGKPI
jgi:hypothetical protein